MNSELYNNNFLILSNFLHPTEARGLREQFKLDFVSNKIKPKNIDFLGLYNVNDWYCYGPTMPFLFKQSLLISDIIGEAVFPSYTYIRTYPSGLELKKHIDRESCEISVSICLEEKGRDWSFWIENPDQEPVECKLGIGDAILYLGTKAPHWRNFMPQSYSSYTQCFFHYVKWKGSYRDFAFEFVTPDQQQGFL